MLFAVFTTHLLLAALTASAPVPFDSPMDSSITATIPGMDNRTIISILATINYGGGYFPAGPYCSKAMELALDRLHLEPGFLEGKYRMSFDLIDDKCDDATIVQGFMHEMRYSTHRLPVSIINQCPNQGVRVLEKIIKYQNNMGFTYFPLSGLPTDRRNSHLIQLLLPAMVTYYGGMFALMRNAGWRKICVISENLPYFNRLEKYVFKIFDQNNISIAWTDKITYKSADENEMNSAVTDMKRHDPRIILANTNSPVSVSCWLFKHQLYGPDYVIFASDYSNFNPETAAIPDYVASWCTRDMIKKVLPSWIFVGISLMTDILGESYVDSTGLSMPRFKEALMAKVISPNFDNVFMWQCYDTALFVGKTIDWGFKTAKERNLSLADLMKNPDIFEEAAFSLRVNGTKAVYDIDPFMKSNSEGYIASTFVQKRHNEDSLLTDVIFGYYKTSHDKYIEMNGGPEWRTPGNKFPKDQVDYVRVVQPANSLVVIVILGVMAGTAVLTCFFVAIRILPRQKATDSIFSLIILVGDITLLIHIFVIPVDSRESNSISLFIISVLILFGFSLSNLSLLFKLHESLFSLRSNSWKGFQVSMSKWKQFFTLITWGGINIGVSIVLHLNSIFIVQERAWNPYVSADRNTIFEPFQYEFAFAPISVTLMILSLSVVAVHIIITIAQVFLAYELTVKLKPQFMNQHPSIDLNVVDRMKADCTVAYTQSLILIALAVATMTATDNGERLSVILAIFLIIYVYLYAGIGHLKQMFQRQIISEEQQVIRRKHKGSDATKVWRSSKLSRNSALASSNRK